jgi:hypothetical protein
MVGGAVGHNFERDPPKDHPSRFGLIRFRGFRGEDLNVKVYDVRRTDGRQVMTKVHMAFGQVS